MINLQGNYNEWIVLLSVLIAVVISYSALNLSYKVFHSSNRSRMLWLIASAVVMGSGIWTIHFVGMLAFHLDLPVHYNERETISSILIGIIASCLAFYVALSKRVSKVNLVAGSVFMGAGIFLMHYLGMSSMGSSTVSITYSPAILLLAFIIAVVSSYGALYWLTKFRNDRRMGWAKWYAALLMGAGVAGMHYTGMESAQFWSASPEISGHIMVQGSENPFSLLLAIIVVVLLIAAVSWAAFYWESLMLKRMAFSDSLTGLPNRHAMNHDFDERLRHHEVRAVLFIDLDQFKLVNDTLGHDIGDLLVQEVGNRINQFVNKDCRMFRLGGDEFLMLMYEGTSDSAEELAESVLKELRRPYWLAGNELYITGSIGISYAPQHGSNRTELLKAADTAMYYAKSKGKNQFCSYNEELDRKLARRMEIENGLRNALMHGQLTLFYQPKWDAATNQPIGFEALLRWNHPQLGKISPEECIPIAEETGLIVSITRWVLEKACLDCKAWNSKENGEELSVSVNLSSNVFDSGGLLDMVCAALERADLQCSLLELEITEATVARCTTDEMKQLKQLQDKGVRISMDNFGSGNSFLGSLDKILFQTLKIDKLYMQDFESPSKRAIVNTIVTLAQQLDIQLVAEGVETEEQLEFLRYAGCSIMQGYYFKKPMPREEVDVWLGGLKALV